MADTQEQATFKNGLGIALGLAFVLTPILGGIGIFCWQILHYLQAGEWASVSIIDLLRRGINESWLYAPDSWVGVWRILNAIPASIACIAFGAVAVGVISSELD